MKSKSAVKSVKPSKPVIWAPQPKQSLMMSRPEYEGFYGGAAGGGKSDYLLVEALRQVHIPNYNAIIFRKTYPQLSELIDRSRWLYKTAYPKAKYNDSKHVWTFPSGAKIYFGNMTRAADKINYQGKRYDFIGFDELTHFTWDEYSYMYSRNRPSGKGTRVYRRATGNPGGIGHGWVKAYFVKAGKPYEPVKQVISVVDNKGALQSYTRDKIFIPSKVYDNQELLNADPNYIANLALLDEADREALLNGNWDTFAGQVFTEFRDNIDGYDTHKFTHVINEFDIPKSWKIYRGFDFGYAKPFSVGWYAVNHDGVIYRIKEFYGCTKVDNTGIKIEPREIARRIRNYENTDPNLKGRKIYGIADPSIWDRSRGESIAEMMEKESISFMRGDNTRLAGKMQYHYRFAFDKEGYAMFYVFNTCKHFIRTIPNLVYDDVKVEDINTAQEDHIYDECRYVFMEHPINPRRSVLQAPSLEDPLDQRKEEIQYFYRV